MKIRNMKFKKMIAAFGLGTALLIFGSGIANAQWWDDSCSARIAHERAELYNSERFYGYYSWQANHERAELNQLLYQCGYDNDSYYVAPRPHLFFGGTFIIGGHHRDRDDRGFRRDHDRDRDHDRH
ncbi:MAG: hypothetical protein PHX83_04225 [Acidobacteriia bacterium]|nr:hypothetical protein [Terriglobia bacterium]